MKPFWRDYYIDWRGVLIWTVIYALVTGFLWLVDKIGPPTTG